MFLPSVSSKLYNHRDPFEMLFLLVHSFLLIRCCCGFFITEKTEFETAVQLRSYSFHFDTSVIIIDYIVFLYCWFSYAGYLFYIFISLSLPIPTDRFSVGKHAMKCLVNDHHRSFAVQSAKWNATNQPTHSPYYFCHKQTKFIFICDS